MNEQAFINIKGEIYKSPIKFGNKQIFIDSNKFECSTNLTNNIFEVLHQTLDINDFKNLTISYDRND